MIIKTTNPKYRIRLTRAYLVEVIDKDENVVDINRHGISEVLDSYCFGTKEQAINEGLIMIDWKESEEK